MKKSMRETWAEAVLADKSNHLALLESDEASGAYLFQIKKEIPWEIHRKPHAVYENSWYAVWHEEEWQVVMSYQEALCMYGNLKRGKP